MFKYMRNIIILVLILSLTVIFAADVQADERPVVVSSFSIIADAVEQVAGDNIDHRMIAPVGAEVHEWELIPENFVALEEADLFFYNGLEIEEWLPQAEATLQDSARTVAIAENIGVDLLPILLGDYEGSDDPHVWMDPLKYYRYIEVIRDELIELDPDNKIDYEINAANYIGEIWNLHAGLTDRLRELPEENRILITSEAAFLYFADRYDFHHDAVWGSNSEEEGTPQQILRVTDIINENQPGAIFYESTISDRHIRAVADDTGSEVFGPLYVDSVAESGHEADNYIGMMRTNIELILEALN